jgi:putative zinc finger protein
MAGHRQLLSPCANLEENLVLFQYGELPAPERFALEQHLSRCANCTRYLQDLSALLPLTIKTDEPPETFWIDYNRELRHKIASAQDSKWWPTKFGAFFQPRLVTAFGAIAVIAVALTLTLGKGLWQSGDLPREDAALMEVLPVAENLEFFKTMDVLDNLDVLEFMTTPGGAA